MPNLARLYWAAVAVGGFAVVGWSIPLIVRALSDRRIPRRPGLAALTPKEHPTLYWGIIGTTIFGMIVMACGAFFAAQFALGWG